MNKRPLHKQNGVSMLEALISTVIVAVALLGLAKINGVTLLASSDSRLKTQAQNLAQDEIEKLRAFPHQQDYAEYDNNQIDASKRVSTTQGGSAKFTRTWDFDSHSFTSDPDVYKQTNVEVNWTDQRGGTQKVKLISNIAKIDPVKSGVALLTATEASKSCTFEGKTYPDGYSITAYKDAVADQCISETRTCTGSTFSGSYTHTTCSQGCKLPDGTYLMSGLKVNLCNLSGVAQAFICLGDNILPLISQVTSALTGTADGLTGGLTNPVSNLLNQSVSTVTDTLSQTGIVSNLLKSTDVIAKTDAFKYTCKSK